MSRESDIQSIESMRKYAAAQAAEAAALRIEVRRLTRDNERLLRRLNKVYVSWTWRVGRLVLFPYYGFVWLRARFRRLSQV